jgi:hypothetical protein
MGSNLWTEVHRASESGILSGTTTPYGFTRNFYWIGANAPRSAKRIDTIAAALARLISGDVVMCAPQTHSEASLVIPALEPDGITPLKEVTLIGAGARGDMWLNTGVASDNGLQVRANYTTLINFGIGGGSSADYALNVWGVEGFRAQGCAFEGPDGTCVLIDDEAAGATLAESSSFLKIRDCEFKFCGSALLFGRSLGGFCTQMEVKDCLSHNFTVVGVGDSANGGGVLNLELTDSVFDNVEGATNPTDYIKVDRVGDDGIISGCRFALATNASADLKIAAGIRWVANATEAGWSTARPS